MKKFLYGFLASIVVGFLLVLYYVLYFKKNEEEAVMEVINHDLKEQVERNAEEFEEAVLKKREEIKNAREEEIIAKVHSYFGLDS